MQTYYLYILECTNGAYYTGYTTNVVRRYQEHVNGSVKCKFTRSFPPQRIAACWKVSNSLSFVLKLERLIKKLTRKDKIALVKTPASLERIVVANGYDSACIAIVVNNNYSQHSLP